MSRPLRAAEIVFSCVWPFIGLFTPRIGYWLLRRRFGAATCFVCLPKSPFFNNGVDGGFLAVTLCNPLLNVAPRGTHLIETNNPLEIVVGRSLFLNFRGSFQRSQGCPDIFLLALKSSIDSGVEFWVDVWCWKDGHPRVSIELANNVRLSFLSNNSQTSRLSRRITCWTVSFCMTSAFSMTESSLDGSTVPTKQNCDLVTTATGCWPSGDSYIS